LISSQLIADNNIEVLPDDVKAFARQQLFSYIGGQILDENQPWIEDYVNRMMQDRKFVEDTYHRVSTDKLFSTLEAQVNATPEKISAEAFAEKLHHHHH
jgi:trigger factor